MLVDTNAFWTAGVKQLHYDRTSSASPVNITSSSGAASADESLKIILIKAHGKK